MDGKLVGTLTYAVDYYTTADYEVMCEDDCFIEEYDLKFIYNGDEYTVDLTLE